MDKDQQANKKFLEEQLQWCKKQDAMLEAIEDKLYEMKAIAEHACDGKLTPLEVNKLNDQLNTLKQEVHTLEQQLQSVLH